MKERSISPIAYIKTPFKEKFGIPRQSGRVNIEGEIVFYKEYNNKDFIRGLEKFSHLWLIFDFSLCHKKFDCPLVRPPKLGGNTKVGVFASRSPFRPNSLGLSSVKIVKINTEGNISIIVSGVDLLDGTPIYDIKPYLPLSDLHLDASNGYAEETKNTTLNVIFTKDFPFLNSRERQVIIDCLKEDPRPSYQDGERVYGMKLFSYNIKFFVEDNIVNVTEIEQL